MNTIIDHYVDMYKFHLGMNIEFIETIYDYATILLVKCYFLEKYATRQVQGTLQGTENTTCLICREQIIDTHAWCKCVRCNILLHDYCEKTYRNNKTEILTTYKIELLFM